MEILNYKNEQDFFEYLKKNRKIPHKINYSYTKFEIPKRNGGKREICVPNTTLKNIQKYIASSFLKDIPFRNCVQAYVHKKSIITNARCHINKNYLLKLDIDNFFPSITYKRVYGLFKNYPFSYTNGLAHKLAKLSTYQNILPQGSPLSPIISNLICRDLDKEIIKLGKKYNFFYTRYSDDITISSKNKISQQTINEIKSIITQNNFTINDKKTVLKTKTQRLMVTGIKVNEKTNLLKKYKNQIRAMLFDWEQNGLIKAQARHNKFIGKNKNFVEVIKGKILYLRQVCGEENTFFQNVSTKYNYLASADGFSLINNKEHILKTACWVIEGDFNQGSCVFISPNILITANHNIEDEDISKIKIFNEYLHTEIKNLSLVAKDKGIDIALLKIPAQDAEKNKSINHLVLRKKKGLPSLKKDYCLIGYPNFSHGDKLKIQYGKILTEKIYMKSKHFEIEQQIYSGNCGGALLDKERRIVGIPQYGNSETQNLVISFEEIWKSSALSPYVRCIDETKQ
ncbi:MAG: reverse transcriptase domain-containing protein [Pseudomonadota bacterium]|nr:reverse transcriptase domain-containing protein [Pseudomonadota bacterium]